MGKVSLWRSDDPQLTGTAFKKIQLGWGIDIILELKPHLDFEVFTNVQASGQFSATAFASGMKTIFYILRDAVKISAFAGELSAKAFYKNDQNPPFSV